MCQKRQNTFLKKNFFFNYNRGLFIEKSFVKCFYGHIVFYILSIHLKSFYFFL